MGILSVINQYLDKNVDEAFSYLDLYKKECPYDCMIDTAYAVALFMKEEYENAYSYIQIALQKIRRII